MFKKIDLVLKALYSIFFLVVTFAIPVKLIAQTATYSPVVTIDAVRGLSTINSAESMGAGRISFGLRPTWYKQQTDYLNSPNDDADVFTVTGAFSYGVNSYVDLFTSLSVFGISNYTKTDNSSGLGTIRAGVQGSIPFPKYTFLRMAGQLGIIGGTSQNQINTYRADGYNYFETRTKYSFSGKLMQTVQTTQTGTNAFGVKLHLNEGGIIGINKNEPHLLLLGAGLQFNTGFAVWGLEINSRTEFKDLAFATDPLWVTPSVHIRTPYKVTGMAGVDFSLSKDRSDNLPAAIEPFRAFIGFSFSFDLLEKKRNAAILLKQQNENEKVSLQKHALASKNEIDSLEKKVLVSENENDKAALKSSQDSILFLNSKENETRRIDSMQNNADAYALKATADSLALKKVENNLAREKSYSSDAERQLLSTGNLLLDAVYFNSGKTTVSMNSKPYLNDIGTMLLKYPKLQITVMGHTDNIGSMESNIKLSQSRADAVRYYLIENAPALSANLDAQGFGMANPKADNTTSQGRQTNRRVELQVKNIDVLQEYRQGN
jgi:outer membrane protein OmpA-like peptidoglycan-associated protein